MLALKISLLSLGAYLFGNLNFALIISKLLKKDVRTMGSGNPGAMNMTRNFGIKVGALTLVMDVVKGAAPCLLGWWLLGGYQLGEDRLGLFIAAFSVVLGHIYPVFLRFKGGKGIASIIGVCLVAAPIITIICFAIGIAFLFLTRIGSISSFTIIFFPLAYSGFRASALYMSTGKTGGLVTAVLVLALFCLTLFAHRANVYKLFSGTENLTELRSKKT